jgi:hypothetical protein
VHADVTQRAPAPAVRSQPSVVGRRDLARAAGHEHEVDRRQLGERRRRNDREPGLRHDRLAGRGDQRDLRAWHARQHLVRSGQIELGQPGEQEHADLHAGTIRRRPAPFAPKPERTG